MFNYLRKAGTTDVSVVIRIVDSTDGTPETGVVYNTAGIDLQYRREGEAAVAITEADLAALTTAHADGGFKHIGNGYYRLDLPDAACATGATGVLVHGTVTGMVVIGCYVQLTAIDLFDAVRMGMTALPNAAADAAGGLPISDAGGLDMDAVKNNVAAILADTGTDGVVVAAASKTGYALSAAGVQAVWDALTSALTTVGSIGKRIVDYLTGDSYVRLGTPAGASIAADIADLPTVSEFEARSLSSADYAVVGDLGTVQSGDVYGLLTGADTELSSVPTTISSIINKIKFVFQYFRNKREITTALETLYKEDAATALGTAALSDDGTTRTKGEMNT